MGGWVRDGRIDSWGCTSVAGAYAGAGDRRQALYKGIT